MSAAVHETVDVAALGYGPANLALAVALEELPATRRPSAVFLEQQPEFGWHRDMLLPGTTIQISFLKDLVSLRNPRSVHSFISYLHEHDRMLDFINGDMQPTRCEFHDYFAWVARRVDADVRYAATALAVRPVRDRGVVTHLDVDHRDGRTGETRTVRARSVVLGMGLVPHLPDGVEASPRVFHSDGLLGALTVLDGDRPQRLLVVGAGQSAAEAARHLHSTYPTSEVVAVLPHFGYSVADDTPFVNQIFDPASTDSFHAARFSARRDMLRHHSNTNYSVVDRQLIEDLYARAYQEKVAGCWRLRLQNLSRVTDARQVDDRVLARILDVASGTSSECWFDAVVCATGYRPFAAQSWLWELGEHVPLDSAGEPQVDRDYRVRTDAEVGARIYLQGPTEGSHGLSSTLLSNVAVRAGEIVCSLVGHAPGPLSAADDFPTEVAVLPASAAGR